MNLTDKDTIVKLMRRRKLAIVGSIIFFIATITFYAYSIFTTVVMTESNGIGGTIKYRSPLFLANLTLYFGTFMILLTCSTLLFVYTKYSLSKTIQLYLEKPIRDISINEFRNARKAIFKGIKNGFMDENLNELPHENTQQFP